MTISERIEINTRIDAMIGNREDFRKSTETMSLSERINARDKYEKLREKLFKIADKNGKKALALTAIQEGNTAKGLTANGKKYVWYENNGLENRSRYCGTLYIEGVGTVFTSGTIAKALDYLLKN